MALMSVHCNVFHCPSLWLSWRSSCVVAHDVIRWYQDPHITTSLFRTCAHVLAPSSSTVVVLQPHLLLLHCLWVQLGVAGKVAKLRECRRSSSSHQSQELWYKNLLCQRTSTGEPRYYRSSRRLQLHDRHRFWRHAGERHG